MLGEAPRAGERIRILIPGNISVTKGALILEKMAQLDTKGIFEFHFLGNAISQLKHIGVHHGIYARNEFQDKVASIKPHIGLVLSIWPETYCHTLTEMWSCGIPVLGIDLGAVGDRIRSTGGGWLMPPSSSAEEVFSYINRQLSDGDGYSKKLQSIRHWQDTEGSYNTTANMATQYRSIYRSVMKPKKPPMLRLGMLLKGVSRGRHWPTAHIRVLRPLAAAAATGELDARSVSVPWLLAGGVTQLDALLIQRDALKPEDAARVLDALDKAGLPWIYEIDDMLWELPAQHKDHGVDRAQASSILKLAARASMVTCSTDILASELRSVARNVQVIPNALDEDLWCAPLNQNLVDKVAKEYNFKDGRQRLIYMGSKSHAADLEMVEAALAKVKAEMPNLHIIQIGGGKRLSMGDEIERPESLFEYHDFVPWFRAVCANSTIAIAPLVDNEFNRSKSDIKAIDYALVSTPAVYSKVPAYKSVLNGQTGLVVENNPDDWARAILKLLNSKQLRTHIRKNALEKARLLRKSGIADQWLSAIRDVAMMRENSVNSKEV
ncbi:hypothetical protein CN645_17615 [Burkholderia sp. IDO3]|nr:glycosyltransferase [Burkholderia sp. IDO3]PCD60661.1 hypothetical protein CN645_17615 [Burkholderia sp. IDO3]